MPIQTSKKTNIYFPDGCVVAVKASGESSYTDVGAINSAVTAQLNFDENQVELANAGKTQKQINNMTMEGGFTLVNLEPASIERLSGGMITRVSTAGTPISTIPDQVIASGWADNTAYDLDMEVSSSDSTKVRTSAQPTLTSVTLDASGTPEVLVEDTEYVVVASGTSASGWAIQFISANMATGSPTTKDITIVYGTNTPIANDTMYAGSSTVELTAYAMRFTHTDGSGKVRQLDLYSVDANSGWLQANFKGANEDGLEELPVTFMAKLDDDLTDGRQLMAWRIDDGAQ